MSAVTGYVLGYEDGRSAAEISRRNAKSSTESSTANATVQVDQSYLDPAPPAWSKNSGRIPTTTLTRRTSFIERRLNGKRMRERHEARAAALQAQLAALQAQLAAARDQAQAAIAQEQAAHQSTHEEKWGLNLFRLIATWLIDAHIAGRSDRPAFAEMRDMAKDVTDAIERGEPFRGYQDEPEKKARLQALLEELLRP